MPFVPGTDGKDVIHVAGDGKQTAGYNDIPLATAANDTISPGGGDDLVFAGAGIDRVNYTGRIQDYSVFIAIDGSINVRDTRPGSPDGTDKLRDVEVLVFSDGYIDRSTPQTLIRTSDGDDSVTIVEDTLTPIDDMLITINGKDAIRIVNAGWLLIDTADGNDTVEMVGDMSQVGLANEFAEFNSPSGGFRTSAAPIDIFLGDGDDVFDTTRADMNGVLATPANFLNPNGSVRLGGGNDQALLDPAGGPFFVIDNAFPDPSPGQNTVTGGVGLWLSLSSTGLVSGGEGVTVDLSTGIIKSAVAGYQTTETGAQNVSGTIADDNIKGDAQANILGVGVGKDVVEGGGQGIFQFDIVSWTAEAVLDLAKGTLIGPGTGFNTVNTKVSGIEGGIGSSFNDGFIGKSTNDYFYGRGGDDTADLGGGDGDIVAFSGMVKDYSIVKGTNGTTIVDNRDPEERPVGIASDGINTVKNAEIAVFADQMVCLDPNGSATFEYNVEYGATGVLPKGITGGEDNSDVVKVGGNQPFKEVEIKAINFGEVLMEMLTLGDTAEAREIHHTMLLHGGIEKVDYIIANQSPPDRQDLDDSNRQSARAGPVSQHYMISGDFDQTAIDRTEGIVVASGGANDKLDASGITSSHGVVFNAGGGTDTLQGGAGADLLDGGLGADSMAGGKNDDTYVVNSQADIVTEAAGGGTDTVLSSVSRILGSAQENLTLTGAGILNGTGNDLANLLIGNAAGNKLDGKGGADTARGGNGNDVYIVNAIGDKVIETAAGGIDRVQASATHTLGFGVEHLTLVGAAAINGTGNGLANQLTGNAAANTLNGKTGADIMAGARGNDIYVVDNAGDKVTENATGGIDTIQSTISQTLGFAVEHLTLLGVGNLNATGNGLANAIAGNGRANQIDGLAGRDTLTGGLGVDQFKFTTALGPANVDVVDDYNVAADTIVLENAVFAALTAGKLDGDAFVVGAAAADAEDRIIYNSASGALLYDADGTGTNSAAIRFAMLDASLALTKADFLVT